MLPASMLTTMRAKVADNFDATCTIRRSTESANSTGDPIPTWSNLATSVACRVRAGSSNETDTTGAIRNVLRYKVLLPFGQDVTAKDRLELSTGIEVEVTDVDKGKSDNLQLVANCIRVGGVDE